MILDTELEFVRVNKTVSIQFTVINKNDLRYFDLLTNKNTIAQFTVFGTIYSFLLKRLISDFDGNIVSVVDNQNGFLFSVDPIDLKISLKEFLQKTKQEVLGALSEADERAFVKNEMNGFKKQSNYLICFNVCSKPACNGISFNIKINEHQDLELQIYYLESFVGKEIVEYLAKHFKNILINLEQNIAIKLSEYPLLSHQETQQLLVDFNNTTINYPENKTIVDLIEEQVLKAPNDVAIIFGEKKLTYADLNERANQLAHFISSKSVVKKGDIIGVFLPKCDEGIISLIAILKLGAVYLPIDVSYPKDRIDYLIRDSGIKLLIADNFKFLSENLDIVVVKSSVFDGRNSSSNLNKEISSKDLAYVIYTSGSTGQPKGVMVEHTSNVNMSLAQIASFEITKKDRIVWFASVSFDASISEIMMCLYSGATLCIPTEEMIKDKDQFIKFLKSTKSTVVTLPPSYLAFLSEKDTEGLRCIITAGEPTNPVKAMEVIKSKVDYYNAYGPTECAVCVSIYKVSENDQNKSIVPIGRQISNTQVFILDELFQPVPIGVMGKIFVSGAGLARGYLNQPELTAEKFMSNPYLPGKRMYDTGDLGRWLIDGNIEFLGRKDNQVKIRGYRVELGEIENAILQYSKEIKQGVVEVKESNNEKALVAYFVSTVNIDKSKLRDFLLTKLPDFMIPGFYIALKKLPLTANGKIDRKALPDISNKDLIRKEYVAPKTKLEKDLAIIWKDVLGLDKIGITDNFFELGGHSLMMGQIINGIHKKLGKTVSFKSFFTNPTIEGLGKELKEEAFTKIQKTPEQSAYLLTTSQERLWMLSQLEGGSIAYIMPAAVKLTGIIDIAKFENSFQLLIARHEILRTYFKSNEEGTVQQYILPVEKIDFKITKEDFSAFDDQKRIISDYLNAANKKVFDLKQAPLIRAALIKLDEDNHVFFLSQHHIIGDGWSMQILIKEIIEIYNAQFEERPVDLPILKIQYKDYAVWLNRELLQEKQKLSESYWLDQFSGEIPVLTMPSFKPRPIIQTYNGNSITHHFSAKFLKELKTFSKSSDVTLFMTLMAGVNTLLHKYSGQDDIIVGTPLAGRDHPDLESQIGLYLNTLAIRTKINPKQSFIEIVNSQKEILLGAYEHQHYPFNSLVNKLNIKRDTSRSALFDVMVILQSQNQLHNFKQEELTSLKVSDYDFENPTSQFDLAFTFTESEVLKLTLVYNTDIYDLQLIKRIFQHFENLLENTVRNFESAIQDIEYLSQEEKQQLSIFNNTEVPYPNENTIIDLFEDQVCKTPKNVAVNFNGTELTYEQLNEKANQFAHYVLKLSSLHKGDFISINIERSEYLIITLLGVLKAGFAYVLIDPLLPKERLNFILNDSGSKLLINDEFITEFENSSNLESKEKPDIRIQPEDVVYLMYTSGSTGNPKGAINVYKGFTNTVRWYVEEIKITQLDKVGIISNLSFDLTQKNYFAPLIIGASIFIDSEFHPINTSKFIKENSISIINCAPSLFYGLLHGGWPNLVSLKKIILGGESINLPLIKNILNTPGLEIFNSYGPSEASDVSIFYQLKEKQENVIPIGRPIRNTTAFILDTNMKQVPIGTSGQICVGGIGVGLGYLNNVELSGEKFVNTHEWGKIYKTGDVGRFNLKGEIEFLGRVDNQVKIRGHRVELEEIENKIERFDKIIKQVSVDVKSINNERVLVAYVVTYQSLNKSELRKNLQEKLPEYMIPSYFVELDELPLTPNGKIDRKALPNVSNNDVIRNEYVAPRTEIEKALVEIWRGVLFLERIGITDNFFELGGHSLMISQVINSIHKKLGKSITFRIFFANPTVELLSKALTDTVYAEIALAPQAISYPLTPSQNRLWLLSQLEGGSVAYNMPASVKLTGEIDFEKFENAFQLFIERHEILRTVFRVNSKDEINQYIRSAEELRFEITYTDYCSVINQDQVISDYLHEENNTTFDLEQGPLLRASLIKMKKNEFVFFLCQHHIIGDGWSMQLLIAEVVKIYNALIAGKEISLPPLRIQYKDYAVWLKEGMREDRNQDSEKYWLQQLSGELPILNLPSFKTRPVIQTYNGDRVTHQFSKEFLEKLKLFSNQQGATLFMILMAGVKSLLYRYTNQDDIIVGTPVAGREHPDLENQMGLFLNTIPIRTKIEDNEGFLELVEKEKQTLLNAYNHQRYPFDALVNKLNLKRDNSRSALFDVLVVFQTQSQFAGNKEELINLEVSDYDFKTSNSKFDLTYTFIETNDLCLSITYNTDIYDLYIIERMFAHFENLLTEALNQPELSINRINYLGQSEVSQLLYGLNNLTVGYPKNKTIVDFFEEQVEKRPNHTAVIFEETSISYLDLFNQVNLLVKHLLENKVEKGDNVVLCFSNHLGISIAGILGILKIGASYVPIDADYPPERINCIIEDTKVKVVVTNSMDSIVFNAIDVTVLPLDNLTDKGFGITENKIGSNLDTAYVIYTSGSTGTPKGVQISHQNINDYIFGLSSRIQIETNESFALMSTLATDLGNTVLFSSLFFGKTLHLFSKNSLRDVSYIQEYFKSHSIDCIKIVPSYWKSLEIGPQVQSPEKMIVFGGEELTINIVEQLKIQRPKVSIVNHYGPTETTIGKLLHRVDLNRIYNRIPLGKAFSNTRLLVVDRNLCLCPIGVEGELIIGGDGVSKGYLNNPTLTQEKIIDDVFLNTAIKLYRTGDKVVMHPDGDIEFRGRLDNQIKILGHRIELTEIESVLNKFAGVKLSVANVQETANGTKRIVAYVVFEQETLPVDELQEYLRLHLPSIMIPSAFIKVDAIPFTSNGKVNRKALLEISGIDTLKSKYVAPRNQIEQKLIAVWQEVLGVEKISITDNFFELGGNSLMIIQVINKAFKELEMKILFKDFFENPTIGGLSKKLVASSYIGIPLTPESVSYPVTSSQNRLWLLSQLEGGSLAYNMPVALKLTGDTKYEILLCAFKNLIKKHEILRTYFMLNDSGELRQLVMPNDEIVFEMDRIDFNEIKSTSFNLNDYLVSLNNQEFNLEKVPLIRAVLIKISDKEHVLFFSRHHIIGDGWSSQIMSAEIIQSYNALIKGEEINREPLKIQYKDYAAWSQYELSLDRNKKLESYWLNKLSGKISALELPVYRTRPLIKSNNGKTLSYTYSEEFLNKLKSFSKNHDVTLFMTLMSGISTLLYLYSGQDDIIVGVPIAGREHPDLEDQIGLYLNTLAIRTQIAKQSRFIDLLNQKKQTLLEAYEHQSYPFDELVGKLNLKRDTSRSALFDVIVVLQNQKQLKTFNNEVVNGLKVEDYNFETNTAQFDISFRFVETQGLMLSIEYNRDVHDIIFIERIFKHLEILLSESIDNPFVELDGINFLSDAERQNVLFDFNDTKVDYPKDKTIIDLFEEQVKRTPNHIAVAFEDVKLSYKELNEQANQLGTYLRKKYLVKPDDLLAIKLEKSEKMIVCILAILKSGGAYVPIDPGFPQTRITYLEQDSQSKVVIDQSFLDEFDHVKGQFSKTDLKKVSQPNNLAYIIYTSGTTGNPKGVMVENKNVVRLLFTDKPLFEFKNTDVWTLFHSYSFDFSVWEMYGALLNGGKVVIISKKIVQDTNAFLNILEKEAVTVLNQTPSAFYNLIDIAFQQQRAPDLKLRFVIFGGEALQPNRLGKWKANFPNTKLINMYGITETTVHVTFKEINEAEIESGKSNIGTAIPTLSCYILNNSLRPLPIGVAGKIYVSGAGVARGYLNKPDLTAEKFMADPFIEGKRMYDSGDLGRWLPDGNIEYLGRKDHQVKIRGHRIELGEIENALSNHELIESSVVLVKDTLRGDKELIAYLVNSKEKDVNTHDLHSYLSKLLPSYMIPGGYVKIEFIPLTVNGKIDKEALSKMEGADLKSGVTFVSPRTPLEKHLVSIWEEVLNKKGIGIKNNFFELGGDSIKSIQIVSRLKQKGFLLNIQDVLRSANIEELALCLKRVSRLTDQSPVTGEISLSPIQSWYFEKTNIDYHHYNQSVLLYSTEQISIEALEKVLEKLIEHHDALRMNYFRNNDHQWKQINKELGSKLTVDILEYGDAETFKGNIQKAQSGFDLQKDILFKAVLFQSLSENKLFLAAHHLIIDGVSWRILLEDISNLYEQCVTNQPMTLPLKTDSFKYWQEKQLEYANSKSMKSELQYWRQLDSQKTSLILLDFLEGSNLVKDVASKRFELTKEQTNDLQTKCYKSYKTEINDILLTALSLSMYGVFGTDNLLVNLEGHGREDIGEVEVSRTIGWYTTIYPVLLKVKDTDQINCLIGIKEHLHQVPQKGIGYGISRYLLKEQYKNEAQLTFNYLGDFNSNANETGHSPRFKFSDDYNENSVSPNRQRESLLDFSGIIVNKRLSITIKYSSHQFRENTMKKLTDRFEQHLSELIELLSSDVTIKKQRDRITI